MLSSVTFLLHASPETFPQSAVAALVPLVFVHDAVSVEPTGVDVVFPDAPPEESLASVARCCSVVLTCCSVQTNGTERTDRGWT